MVNQSTRTDIEISEIAQELQREISDRHAQMGRAQQSEGDSGANLLRDQALERVFAKKRVNPHQPIAWPNWPTGLWPKAVAAVQKIVRRLLRWYIDPIVEQQNTYNAEIADTLALLHSRSQALEETLAGLQARLAEIELDENWRERYQP
jgi:hypothetical protein